jgi:oligoribonuclease
MVDVSTVKELARRWFPALVAKIPPKNETHRALDDIRESIDELRWYRQHVFAPPPPPPPPAAPPGAPTPPPAAG